MASFLVIGDGVPASKVAAAAAAAAGARLVATASTRPPLGGAVALPDGSRVEAVESAILRQEAGLAWARRTGADWLLCINSTVLLPSALIDAFGGRALNSHPGPLPEYGGLHAHQWAIRNGETEYGATVHRMEARIDAGPVVASTRFPIREEDTGLSLFRRALVEAADLLASVVVRIADGETLPSVPQDVSRRRVFRHREALDGRIDWRSPARSVVDFVRAGNYEPFRSPTYVAVLETPSGATVEVLRAELAGATDRHPGALVVLGEGGAVLACGDGQAVRITRAREATGVVDSARWRQLFPSGPAP